MSGNVISITHRFDADTDKALDLFRDQETHQIPAFGALLVGPASELDAVPAPRAVVVKCQRSIGWALVGGFVLGVAYMALLTWITS